MNQAPYPYTRTGNRYTFISRGKNDIVKIVDFTILDTGDVYTLVLGEPRFDGGVDDIVISNNGDIVRVLSTVISIAIDFLDKHPDNKIFFSGSTDLRTAMYHRILTMYYLRFSSNFRISALVLENDKLDEINFDPNSKRKYTGFFIKRKKLNLYHGKKKK